MAFEDIYSRNLAMIYDRLAEHITYTPQGGSTVNIRGVPVYRNGDSDLFTTGTQSPTLFMEVRVSELTLPAEGDSLTYNGTQYRVATVELQNDQASWRLLLREAT